VQRRGRQSAIAKGFNAAICGDPGRRGKGGASLIPHLKRHQFVTTGKREGKPVPTGL